MKRRLKRMPSLRSDAAAERFVATADLTEYDLRGFKPMRFEVGPKARAETVGLHDAPLDALKAKAIGGR
jgi:predicted DNA binding CopG/RHH family protein